MTYTIVSEQQGSEAAHIYRDGCFEIPQGPCKSEELDRPQWNMRLSSSCRPQQPSNMQISDANSFTTPAAWNDSSCSLRSVSYNDSNMSILETPSPMHSAPSTQSVVPPDVFSHDPIFDSQGFVVVEKPPCVVEKPACTGQISCPSESPSPLPEKLKKLAFGARDSIREPNLEAMKKDSREVQPGLLPSEELEELYNEREQTPPFLQSSSTSGSVSSVMSYNSTPVATSPMVPAMVPTMVSTMLPPSASHTPNPGLPNVGYSVPLQPQSQNGHLMVPAPITTAQSEGMLLRPTGSYCLTYWGYQPTYEQVAPVETHRAQSLPIRHTHEEGCSQGERTLSVTELSRCSSRASSCSLTQQLPNAQPNLVSAQPKLVPLQYPIPMYSVPIQTSPTAPILTRSDSIPTAAQLHPPIQYQSRSVPPQSSHQLMRGSVPASPYTFNSQLQATPLTWSTSSPILYSPQSEQQQPQSHDSPSPLPLAQHGLWDTVAHLETRSIAKHQGAHGPVNIYQVVDPNNKDSPAVCSIIDYMTAEGEYVASKYEPKTADKDRMNPNVILVACTREDEPFSVHFDTEEERNKCLKSMERKYNLADMTEFYPAFQAIVKTDKTERKRRYDYIKADYKRWYPVHGVEKKEIMIKNLHPNAKIKDVKNVFNEMGEVKHVAMPMNKETEEYEAFSCWKDNVDNCEPKPDHVPNGRACYIVFKNMESAIRALTICHYPNLANKFGGLEITWSNDCSSRRRKQGRNRRNMLNNNKSFQH